ncbi:ABC transporter substrate-binding protein [Candidatus Chloroploca sp. Khr17]|uniref:ABC transporter substrate-binding protein n=1 Tax=Candidatus Chloroploca sp. Khr17 TaxID=2496869 RepID=UPI00101CD2EF|nr:ABC transporter substrate-binding protein [Candidatus Chloroploca sp. Khr17]
MRHWQFAIISLLVLGVLVSCGAPATSTAPPTQAPEATNAAAATAAPTVAARTRLVAAAPQLPDILDAHQSYDGAQLDVEQIGQTLVRIDSETGALIPDLAESWSFSDDGTVLTIVLPEGAAFSNGDPLDAQALKDSWLRYKEISPFGSDLESLAAINVVDATTVEATFTAPPAALFAVLETVYGGPWNVALARQVGDPAFAINPIASGPLVVAEFTPGSDLLLVRNDNYQTNLPFVENKGPLHLTEVYVRAIPEDTTLAGELETGAVDLIMNVPASAIERLRANPDIQLYELARPGYTGLVMSHQHPLFSDLRVRQAIAYAIDREALSTVLGDVAAPQYAFINQAMIAYSPEAEAYAQQQFAYDLAAARATLAEAGWADSNGDGIVEKDGQPFAVELLISDDSVANLAAQVLQSQLKEIGIDLTIVVQDAKLVNETLTAGDFDLSFDVIGWRDPDIFALAFGAPFWNFAKYDNPASQAQLEAARQILNPAERSAAYAELQKMWVDDVVEIPLWQNRRFVAARTWVKGLIVTPTTGQVFLNDVMIEP